MIWRGDGATRFLGWAPFGAKRSVGAQWRPQQRHVVLLEDRGDDRSVWCPVPGGGSKLFVEPVPPTGRVHHDDLARLIGQVEERVGDLRWQVGKAALIELERALLADHSFGVDAYGVLITLVSAPGGTLTIGDLGERRNLSPSGVSRSVDRLPKNGLGRRGRHPPARRAGPPPRGRPPAAARPPERARSEAPGRAVGEGDARLGLQSRLAAVDSTGGPRRLRVDPSASADAAHTAASEENQKRPCNSLVASTGADLGPMRPNGLEPSRGNLPTRPSTLRVYQFRHERREGNIAPVLPLRAQAGGTRTCIRPQPALDYEHMFVAAHRSPNRGGIQAWI